MGQLLLLPSEASRLAAFEEILAVGGAGVEEPSGAVAHGGDHLARVEELPDLLRHRPLDEVEHDAVPAGEVDRVVVAGVRVCDLHGVPEAVHERAILVALLHGCLETHRLGDARGEEALGIDGDEPARRTGDVDLEPGRLGDVHEVGQLAEPEARAVAHLLVFTGVGDDGEDAMGLGHGFLPVVGTGRSASAAPLGRGRPGREASRLASIVGAYRASPSPSWEPSPLPFVSLEPHVRSPARPLA